MPNPNRTAADPGGNRQSRINSTIEGALAALASVVSAIVALLFAPFLFNHIEVISHLLSSPFGESALLAAWTLGGLTLAAIFLGLRAWFHVALIKRSVKRLLK